MVLASKGGRRGESKSNGNNFRPTLIPPQIEPAIFFADPASSFFRKVTPRLNLERNLLLGSEHKNALAECQEMPLIEDSPISCFPKNTELRDLMSQRDISASKAAFLEAEILHFVRNDIPFTLSMGRLTGYKLWPTI